MQVENIGSAVRAASVLSALVGATIVRVCRVLFSEDLETGVNLDGPLELWLDRGTVLLDVAEDAHTLEVVEQPWREQFVDPLTPEQADFVSTHGKWMRVDVSAQPEYARLVNQPIASADLLEGEAGIVGAVVSTTGTSIWFVAAFDECHVYWERPPGVLVVKADAPGSGSDSSDE